MRLSLTAFWMGRDVTFAEELTDEIVANGRETLRRANRLLAAFQAARPEAATRGIVSGWRPRRVNACTRNAAATSCHLTAEAVDLSDDDEALDRWCLSARGLLALEACGLWLEHPDATPRWCHLQTRAPASGRRVFMP